MTRLHDRQQLPVIALRTDVHLPGAVVPIEVGRDQSVRAVDAAAKDDSLLVIVPQRDPEARDPSANELLDVGILCEIVQVVKHARQRYTVTLRLLERVRILEIIETAPLLIAVAEPLRPIALRDGALVGDMAKTVRDQLALIAAHESDNPEEIAAEILAVDDPDDIVDVAASHIELPREDILALLREDDPEARLRLVMPHVKRMHDVLKVKADIHAEIHGDSARQHRERVLRERMRAIQEELGEVDEDADLEEYRDRIAASEMPDEVRAAARRQISRMSQMQSSSPEYTVARTYVETLLDIPFGIHTEDLADVIAARAILEAEHAGLEKVKKRILEFIAVRKLAPDRRGPILCLYGPPGVGKTSLGRSIASALGRKYVRAALGGVRDESEIRGHRRTYIGALPGRIVNSLKKAGSMNPVFILDEIDKVGSSVRGDPASALLEVLDPEQNKEFVDHYLELPVDLSKVMFIATANDLDTIPSALLDRMEIIRVPGYTADEKKTIARSHLLPKQLNEHGLDKETLTIGDDTLDALVNHYTRESGVRNLEREIASLCRAAAVKIAGEKAERVDIKPSDLDDILGPPRYFSEVADRTPEVGVATGLAWTPMGGEIMFIEARMMTGRGELKLTGQLGDVMRESAQAALSWVRSVAATYGIADETFAQNDIHLHLPSGAVRKDGPSAGVAIAIALISAVTGKPVRNDIAITGEINLRGQAMQVGGIKEKVLAAHRAGIRLIFLPHRNEKDLVDVPKSVQDDLDIRFMTKASEAIQVALSPMPRAAETPPAMPPPTAAGAPRSSGDPMPA